MEELIVKLATDAGPVVVVAALFLGYLHFYTKASAQRWKEKDDQLTEVVTLLMKTIERNNQALTDLRTTLQTKPCLWEDGQKSIVAEFKTALTDAVRSVRAGQPQ